MSYGSEPGESRPLPIPTELSQPHWDGAREGRLMVQHCPSCAAYVWIPRRACPHCLAEPLDWVQSSGKGEVYSFTIIHRPPHPAFEPPYVAAIVQLAEGWHMLTNIVGCDPAEVAVGQAVEVQFLEEGEITLPVFRPLR